MSEGVDPQDEIISFPVPRRYYDVVVRALHDAIEAGATILPPSSPEELPPTAIGSNKGWTREGILALKSKVHNATVHNLLDMASQRPGQWIGFRDLMERTGRTYGEARGDLAGFTQLLKRQFDTDQWPLVVHWSDTDGQIRYQMSDEVAAWWKQA